MASKHLINDTETCVDDALNGFLRLNYENVVLYGQHRLVVRRDVEDLKKIHQVVLLSGGGAGHEPAHIGYVGKGMLTAAVSGNVFSSPSIASILFAIRQITQQNEGGCLLIVKNYSGDRLNFGLALKKAQLEGIHVKMVIISDDCALTSPDNSAGKRGLCGTILVHKIAGAMAEHGRRLEEILEYIENIKSYLGTIGMSLSSCAPPGTLSTYKLDNDTVEIGLGIHGEPGIVQTKMTSARDIVHQLFNRMTNKESKSHLQISSASNIVVVINNLGGLSDLEMNIFLSEVLKWLDERKINVKRVLMGRLMTSLDMKGVSITILHADTTILQYLDEPCGAPAWPKSFVPSNDKNQLLIPVALPIVPIPTETDAAQALLNTQSAKMFKKCIENSCAILIEKESMLNELDSYCGDGDCGTTLCQGAKGIKTWISTASSEHLSSPQFVFAKLAEIVETMMGGTSGAMYNILFTAIATSFKNFEFRNTLSLWTDSFLCGFNAVMELGGAKPGDRTMVDALNVVAEMIESDGDASILELLKKIVKKIADINDIIRYVKAKKGRASYVNKRVTDDHHDPGAIAIYLIFNAIFKCFLRV